MNTSVFFTNNYIRAVVGTSGRRTAKIEKACQTDLPQGCLINGLITNEGELEEILREFWKKNNLPKKGVQISVTSSRFTVKNMKAPMMNRKRTLEYIRNGFPEVENKDAMIFDCQMVHSDQYHKMNEVLAVMAEKELVNSFAALFEKLEITADSIRPTRCSLISMFAASGMMKDKNCVVQMVEGNNLRSILYLDGEYIYSGRSRLFSTRATEDVGREISRSVSSMRQFLLAEKIEKDFDEVFLSGLLPVEIDYSRDSIALFDARLSVKELEGDFVSMPPNTRFVDYAACVADLMAQKNGVNLFRASKEQNRQNEKLLAIWLRLRPLVFLGLFLSAVTAALLVGNFRKEAELDELLSFNTDPENVAAHQESLALQNRVDALRATMTEVGSFTEAKDSYPWADSSVTAAIERAAGNVVEVTVNSYQSETGSLQMTAEAADVTEINGYIDALENTGIFEQIEYSGYRRIEKEEQMRYSIHVICHLTAEAGKTGGGK